MAESPSIQYLYDTPAASCGAGETFAIGRLAGIARGGETIEYCSDRFGRTTRDGELTYAYDENGNRTGIGYPGGVTATYGFDSADRETSLTVDDGVNPPQPVASGATYEPFGPLSGLTLGNGLVETRDHDARYVPDAITAGSLLSWDYTTDGVGNIEGIADLLTPADSRTYAYQEVQYFLTGADGPWGSLSWTYDRIGNRLTEDRDAVLDTYAYLANGCVPPGEAGRPCPGNTAILDSIALGAGGTRDYAFGAAGHLEEVLAGANQVVFDSDGEGRLTQIRRPASGESAEFAYDGRSFLSRASEIPMANTIFADGFETGDTGCWSNQVGGPGGSPGPGCFNPEARRTRPLYDSRGVLQGLRRRPDPVSAEDLSLVFHFAGRPVGQLEVPSVGGATWTYLTTDQLGTPVLVSDSAAAEVWSGGFEPFGADWQEGTSVGASENGIFLRLPGQWRDEAWELAGQGTNSVYNLYRWLETGAGRYTKTDPLGLLGGPQPYGYAMSNPLSWVDPTGQKVELYCHPIGAGGDSTFRKIIGKAGFSHCFIRIKCNCEEQGGPYDLRLELDGREGWDTGTISGEKQFWFGHQATIVPTSPADWDSGDCQRENCIRDRFNQLASTGYRYPPYGFLFGPNSNTFAVELLGMCGVSEIYFPSGVPPFDNWQVPLLPPFPNPRQ